MPASVNTHSGATVVDEGHVKAVQATESPVVPANDPVGVPPTTAALNDVAAVALPNNVLSRVTVPPISMVPVIEMAWTERLNALATSARPNVFVMFIFVLI